MNRRHFLRAAAALPLLVAGGGALARSLGGVDLSQQAAALWEAWKEVHLTPDGRVVDAFQNNASHSEGQGYGMLLATEFDDHGAFRRMFDWTEMNLAQRGDGLLSWRWLPGQANPVPDPNNATDGDLFYAWALVRATRRWSEPHFMTRAISMAQALAENCIVRDPARAERTLLLPAVHGFTREGSVTINPSYYMPLAMREVAAATGVSAIQTCAQDGEALLSEIAARGLPPDWIDLGEDGWAPSGFLPSHTGYEAMRVPLFLIWSGQSGHPAVRQMASVYERTAGNGQPVPTVLDPETGSVLDTSPDPGYRALAGLTRCARYGGPGAEIPPFQPRQPYYPATLQLFAMIAANEVLSECVPV
ncbi:MAG: glycosyl hydrolase family 5 [Rhodobacteraceae bacterium]|nr:glycosyl hydrolase family 5 [Paracoccaceae bacterium]